MKQKIVIAVTGASGSLYARILLDKLVQLQDQLEEVSVVMSSNAREVWQYELGNTGYEQYPFRFFHHNDFYAPFASGSAGYHTMIIVPCSAGTLGRIAGGISNDLVSRGADVMLKERRKLILVLRETPLNLVQIRNMETVTLAGGIICPATPSFYSLPQTVEEVATTVVNRVIDLAGLTSNSFRWGSSPADTGNQQ
jgi:4-hydroxy-3-polyprenylbenzoate decarboxylase